MATISGLLFGSGLTVSGMIDPGRVLGFLDLAALAGDGVWDPTLGFVMAGALITTVIGYAALDRQEGPIAGTRFEWASQGAIDRRLLIGAAIFGVGWGLIGFCPGPAIAALSSGLTPVFVFVGAVVSGMLLHRAFQRVKPL